MLVLIENYKPAGATFRWDLLMLWKKKRNSLWNLQPNQVEVDIGYNFLSSPIMCILCHWTEIFFVLLWGLHNNGPDSKVHGANMGPIWGRQDPGGPHVGPMNFAKWGVNGLTPLLNTLGLRLPCTNPLIYDMSPNIPTCFCNGNTSITLEYLSWKTYLH